MSSRVPERHDNENDENNDRLKKKENQLSFKDGMKDKTYRLKFFHSLTLCFSFFTVGIILGQEGPSFLDLQLITNTDVQKAATFFTAASVGYMFGSLIGGILLDKYNKLFILTICALFLSITTAVIPLCTIYGLMLFMFFASAFCMGCLDTGGNSDIVSIWGGAEGRFYVQVLQFSYAFGSVISPLYTAPFLAEGLVSVDGYIVAESPSNTGDRINFTNITSNITMLKELDGTRLLNAYIISALLTFLSSIFFLILFIKTKGDSAYNAHLPQDETVKRQRLILPLRYLIIMIIFVDIFFFFVCAVEDTFSYFLSTFTVLHLNWSKESGSQLTSLFWGSYAGGRFLGIFLVKRIKPVRLLIILMVCSIFSLLAFLLCAFYHQEWGIWVFTVFIGISSSGLFPIGFSWTHESVLETNGKVMGSILVFGSAGTMVNSLLIGYLVENVHPMWYCYLLLLECIVCFVWFLFVNFISTKLYSRKGRSKTSHTRTIKCQDNGGSMSDGDDVNRSLNTDVDGHL